MKEIKRYLLRALQRHINKFITGSLSLAERIYRETLQKIGSEMEDHLDEAQTRLLSNRPGLLAHHHIFLYCRPPVSSSLTFCNRSCLCCTSSLERSQKDFHQYTHSPFTPLNFTS